MIGSNVKVADGAAQRERAAEQQRLAEAAAARATEAEERASRAENDRQTLIAQAKTKEEAAAKAVEQQRVAEAAAKAEQQRLAEAAAKATKDQPFVNSLGMKFVPVPITASPTGAQKVLFCVWETRVQDYRVFIEKSGYDMSRGPQPKTMEPDASSEDGWAWKEAGGSWQDPHFPAEIKLDAQHPVVCVSPTDAKAFCAWLSQKDGLKYRLPTDYEWSCAVGIGNQENPRLSPDGRWREFAELMFAQKVALVFPWGKWPEAWPPPANTGNFSGEESRVGVTAAGQRHIDYVIAGYNDGAPRTARVGSYPPNFLGIFDLAGNVAEICEGQWDTRLQVTRGSSWFTGGYSPWHHACQARYPHSPYIREIYTGFRVVLEAANARATEMEQRAARATEAEEPPPKRNKSKKH